MDLRKIDKEDALDIDGLLDKDFDSEFITFSNDVNFLDNINSESNEQTGMPGAYCTFYGDKSLLSHDELLHQWHTVKSVIHRKHFRSSGSTEVLTVIENIIKHHSVKGFTHTIFNNGKTEFYNLFNIEEGVYIDQCLAGVLYAKLMLQRGTPIVFGVNTLPYSVQNNIDDCSTNHYILVVGMGNDGDNYFYSWDLIADYPYLYMFNGDTFLGGISFKNKIYFDTVWPGLLKARERWGSQYAQSHMPYRVTKIFKTFKHSTK